MPKLPERAKKYMPIEKEITKERQPTEYLKLESKEEFRQRILVIDDLEENRNTAARYFKSLGRDDIEVDYAGDYEEAIKKLESGAYSAIASDFLFPEQAGSNKTELGVQTTYELLIKFKNYAAKEEKKKENLLPFTKEDFQQLLAAAKDIKREFEKRRNNPEIQERIEVYATKKYGADAEGAYLKDQMIHYGEEGWGEKWLTGNELARCEKVVKRLKNQFLRGWDWVPVQVALGLVANDESLQPLGWKITQKAEEKQIKYIIVSSAGHGGYADGFQGLLAYTERYSEWDRKEGKKMPETTKLYKGDKTNIKTWEDATQYLIKKKDE